MEKTKVAILGAGFIAHIHLESYKRFVHEAEVVAIYARSREKVEAVAAEFGIPGVYDDVDKLLAESGAEVVTSVCPTIPTMRPASRLPAAASTSSSRSPWP